MTLVGDHVTRVLSARARQNVKDMQRQLRAPEAVILLAAYLLLLSAHGAGPDLLVGSPVSARPATDPQLVGHHTNVLPLRLRTDPAETFRDWTLRARDTYFSALSHADVPVDSVPGLLPQTPWGQRVFRYLFNYFPGLGLPDFTLGTTTARPVPIENGFNKFDLEFFLAVTPETLRVMARYGVDRLRREDAEALLVRYEALLEALPDIVDLPTGAIPVWSAEDVKVIEAANATDLAVPRSIVEAVYNHAVNTPEAPAALQGERTVGYGQLWDYATTTAATLTEAGVTPGDVVALAASRTPELLGTALGVWLAGATYLPVDPEHPAERISYLLGDSGARLLVTDRALDIPEGTAITTLPLAQISDEPGHARWRPRRPREAIDPDTAAYLIYTSGTSGRPKGALIRHRSIANIAVDYTDRLSATPDDATLWMTTFAFDMANLEIYTPLYSGGRIVIAPDKARTDGRALAAEIRRHRPSILQATPTTLRLVLDEVEGDLAGTKVVTGGENVPVPLAARLLTTGCELHHAYGPTETVTWCTWGVVQEASGDRLDIGKPIANTRVMVMAPDGRELPVGVSGEVCIAGDGVALGYHGRPDLTEARFGTHPLHGRYYRSGDLGRWRPDGTLELFGRGDRQIKLNGNRIELGEVEAVLLGHDAVRVAAVVLVDAANRERAPGRLRGAGRRMGRRHGRADRGAVDVCTLADAPRGAAAAVRRPGGDPGERQREDRLRDAADAGGARRAQDRVHHGQCLLRRGPAERPAGRALEGAAGARRRRRRHQLLHPRRPLAARRTAAPAAGDRLPVAEAGRPVRRADASGPGREHQGRGGRRRCLSLRRRLRRREPRTRRPVPRLPRPVPRARRT